MSRRLDQQITFYITVALAGWLVPGAGYYLQKDKLRAVIIGITIIATFATGIYVGSIYVINPTDAKLWYIAQMMTSPAVALIGNKTTVNHQQIYGKPNEIGQIYTSIAGLLNLLCIVNCVHHAYLNDTEDRGKK